MSAYEEVQQAEEGDMAIYTPIAGSRFMLPYWSPYNKDGSLASENNEKMRRQCLPVRRYCRPFRTMKR